MRPRWYACAGALLLAACGSWAIGASDFPQRAGSAGRTILIDGFEDPDGFPGQWYTAQLLPGRYRLDASRYRSGRQSLALSIEGTDRGCGPDCQRNEIRTPAALDLEFGRESTIRFSFRIDSDGSQATSTRWISGQWKQDNSNSPFLSQRFDRGVFHIAVHDGDCRVLVARASADFDPVGTTIDTSIADRHAFVPNKRELACRTEMRIESPEGALLPDPFLDWVDMSYRVRGGRDGKGLVEIRANGRLIARATGPIGHEGAASGKEYFKFGIYRDAQPGRATVLLDDVWVTTPSE